MEPSDRRYSKQHEWVKLEGDRGTVGITDFAQPVTPYCRALR